MFIGLLFDGYSVNRDGPRYNSRAQSHIECHSWLPHELVHQLCYYMDDLINIIEELIEKVLVWRAGTQNSHAHDYVLRQSRPTLIRDIIEVSTCTSSLLGIMSRTLACTWTWNPYGTLLRHFMFTEYFVRCMVEHPSYTHHAAQQELEENAPTRW